MIFFRSLLISTLVLFCACNPSNSGKRSATDIAELFDVQTDSLSDAATQTEAAPTDSPSSSNTTSLPATEAPTIDTNDVLQLPFERAQGQKYSIRLTKEQKKVDAGKIKKDERSVSNIDVVVKEGNSQGYILEWIYRDTNSNSSNEIHDKISELDNLVQHESIVFQVDSTGSPLELVNGEELVSSIQLLVEAIVSNSVSKIKTESEKRLFKDLMTKILSPERIQSELQEPLSLMHIASGGAFVIGDTIHFETTLPNFLGGDPMKSFGYMSLVEYNERDQRAKIIWGQDVDPEEAREFIVAMLKQLTINTGKPLDLEELPSFNISDRAIIEIDLNGGWVLSSDYTRTTSALTMNQTERVLIETTPPVN